MENDAMLQYKGRFNCCYIVINGYNLNKASFKKYYEFNKNGIFNWIWAWNENGEKNIL